MRSSICLLSMMLLFGCATPVGSFAPGPLSSQSSAYSNGAPVLLSRGEKSEIAISTPAATADRSQRVELLLLVRNLSDQPITVGPGDMSVLTDSGRSLHVYTAIELEREARSRAAWAQFGAAMQMMSNSMAASNAGYSTTHGSVAGNYSNYGGYGNNTGSFTGVYSGSTYDSGAAARAQAQANQQNAAIAEDTRRRTDHMLANAQSGAFQVQTIVPGGSYFTPVTVDRLPRNSNAILIQLNVAGEQHRVDLVYRAGG